MLNIVSATVKQLEQSSPDAQIKGRKITIDFFFYQIISKTNKKLHKIGINI